jgi:hypothetical protein
MDKLDKLIQLVSLNHGIGNKARLAEIISGEFNLVADRKVYYCDDFAIRYSSASSSSFSNTVLSLSNLRKVDDIPFIVCLVTPSRNYMFLANTTLLKKISHTSQLLRVDNIRGSFNGSDILRSLAGIQNEPANFRRLFDIHREVGFDGNLPRLVEATNNISPKGAKYEATDGPRRTILESPQRAQDFIESNDSALLKKELDDRVSEFKNEILVASMIDNVNIRGRIIEYLIAGEDEELRNELILALKSASGCKAIPEFKTDNSLGDYSRVFERYVTETDVKTKIMILSSNPKAYNLDKILQFLSIKHSVFLFYFIGIDLSGVVSTVLVSMFQKELLQSTILLKHWSGRNSRGVSQFEGKTIESLILNPNNEIDINASRVFLENVISL